MATGKKKHQISISNFKDSETVDYAIILLKGLISNESCDEKTPKLMVENLQVHLGPKNNFKVLIKLHPGKNRILFNYCCGPKEFFLNYSNENSNKRRVQPLYVIFKDHDGTFQAPSEHENSSESACEKINLNCLLLQTVLAEKLYENQLGRRSFVLDTCQVFRSKLTIGEAFEMDNVELWTELGKEICSHFLEDHENSKFLAFLAGTTYQGHLYRPGMLHEHLIGITRGYIAVGIGGLAVFNTACLYTWPSDVRKVIEAFECERSVDKTMFLDDSAYRGTWGACYSTTLGSVLHELCHTFDLGHSNYGVMSRGFDDLRDVFLRETKMALENDRRRGNRGITDSTVLHKSGAWILRYHKWFNYDNIPGNVTFDPKTFLLKSSLGLKVVEIRKGVGEMTVEEFCFKIPKFQHKIQEGIGDILVAQDSKGNLFKAKLNN